ncbi:hypothetical protein BDR04DRAFT_1087125 [Suillus decipiens]|nr:hypothetical protein BDR04DRAFT_1087125 [Suillus decipiens]
MLNWANETASKVNRQCRSATQSASGKERPVEVYFAGSVAPDTVVETLGSSSISALELSKN